MSTGRYLLKGAVRLGVVALVAGCVHEGFVTVPEDASSPKPVKIIFDTDMISDFDDVGAVACLHALADAGECEILATLSCTRANRSVAAIEILNAWYGRPDIPVGCAKGMGVSGSGPEPSAKDCPLDRGGHAKYVQLAKDYPQWVKHLNSDDAPDANEVYRRVLAAQPDHSVVICSVGFLTNLRRLLETKPDAVSPLDGRALVAKKVKLWVAMACQYPKGKEYNSRYDAESSAIALANWPTPIAFTDFEYGMNVYTGRRIAEDPTAGGPVKDVFLRSLAPRSQCTDKSWDRLAGHPSWDETAVLYAVRGAGEVFGIERGSHRMTGTDGSNVWKGDPESRDLRLVERLPYAEVGKIIDELMCRKPKRSVPLVGDGVADDTAAIQARLDSGAGCVYLPPPKDHYVISRTLKIGSNQELRLDRFTRIRLAPKSNCPMLENRCYRAGAGTNAFVAVTGGVWDMDNRSQRPNFMQVPELAAAAPKTHTPDFFFGMAIRFCHVEHLTVRGVTIRNPSNYGIEFGHASYVTADDVTFDYREGNPYRLNMDGLHFDGHCHHLRISNVRGTCFDDMIALNANDGMCSPEEGPISDVTIDGLYCEYCHSGVRLLSADAPVSHVTIRNVHGNFYISAVWLTHNFGDRPAPGRFDDIVITDVFAGKALPPPEVDCSWRRALGLIHIEGNSNVGSLVLERIYRDESTLPAATILQDNAKSTIEHLVVRDCRMTNRLGEPIRFLDFKGTVQKLVNENNMFVGEWTR